MRKQAPKGLKSQAQGDSTKPESKARVTLKPTGQPALAHGPFPGARVSSKRGGKPCGGGKVSIAKGPRYRMGGRHAGMGEEAGGGGKGLACQARGGGFLPSAGRTDRGFCGSHSVLESLLPGHSPVKAHPLKSTSSEAELGPEPRSPDSRPRARSLLASSLSRPPWLWYRLWCLLRT